MSRLLMENGTDGYLLEDSSGVLLLEGADGGGGYDGKLVRVSVVDACYEVD